MGGGFAKKSSLILAVEARNLEMVQAIRPRANKNLVNYAPGTSNIFGMRSSREDTALHLACYNGDYEIVRELKKYEGFDVNVLGCSNNSALFSALGGMEDALYQLNTKKVEKHKEIFNEGFSLLRKVREEGKLEECEKEIKDKYNKKLAKILESATESMRIIKRYFLTLKELLEDKNFNLKAENTALTQISECVARIKSMEGISYPLTKPDGKYKGLSYLDYLLIKLYEMLSATGAIDVNNEKNKRVIEEINELYAKQQNKSPIEKQHIDN